MGKAAVTLSPEWSRRYAPQTAAQQIADGSRQTQWSKPRDPRGVGGIESGFLRLRTKTLKTSVQLIAGAAAAAR